MFLEKIFIVYKVYRLIASTIKLQPMIMPVLGVSIAKPHDIKNEFS